MEDRSSDLPAPERSVKRSSSAAERRTLDRMNSLARPSTASGVWVDIAETMPHSSAARTPSLAACRSGGSGAPGAAASPSRSCIEATPAPHHGPASTRGFCSPSAVAKEGDDAGPGKSDLSCPLGRAAREGPRWTFSPAPSARVACSSSPSSPSLPLLAGSWTTLGWTRPARRSLVRGRRRSSSTPVRTMPTRPQPRLRHLSGGQLTARDHHFSASAEPPRPPA
jgi:hypothetical protein